MSSEFLYYLLLLYSTVRCEEYMENFQQPTTNISLWREHSDTIMKVGKSKSSFVLQKSSAFQRAILFTLLNPQPCGAALAGIKKHVQMNLSEYSTISLSIRGQGQYKGYEFIIRHNGESGIEVPSYCHFFEAPSEFEIVSLSLKDFKPYLQGRIVENSVPLNTANVTSIGILSYGGAHLHKKQKGVASLEIDWIKVR